jgi:hypothetical protein
MLLLLCGFALGDVTPWLNPVSWMNVNEGLRMGATPWDATIPPNPVRLSFSSS